MQFGTLPVQVYLNVWVCGFGMENSGSQQGSLTVFYEYGEKHLDAIKEG
jgi:hypothetical protein